MTFPHIDVSNLPSVQDPWGPSEYTPESLKFNGVPYAPFIKTDKLGKIADWQAIKEEDQLPLKNANLKNKRDLYHAYGASAAKLFGAETEEKGFFMVENATPSSSNKQAVLKGGRKNQTNNNKLTENLAKKKVTTTTTNVKKTPIAQKPSRWGNQTSNNKWGANKWNNEEIKLKEASIVIDENWKSVAEIEFNRLTKLNLDISAPETLSLNGKIFQHHKKYEANTIVPLEPTFKTTYNQTSSSDPNLESYAQAGAAKVFITDAILSQLMCAPKSSASWDIIVTKKNGNIFFDKRENTFDILINENSQLKDIKESDVNHPSKLQLELTEVSDAFIFGSLAKNSSDLGNKSPITVSSAIPKGYKYVKYELPNGSSADDNKGTIPVIVRASLDAYTFTSSSYVSIHSLLQVGSNDWRTKFQGGSQGNIFADEIKKNNNLISQWTTQSVLGGVKSMKIGFISRENAKINKTHFVAGTMTLGVDMLCQQLNVSIKNGWGIVKSFIDIIEHEGGDEDYRFVIFKTPNSQKIIIYKVPFDSFTF
jgi:translation initiation factor 3 subunit D